MEMFGSARDLRGEDYFNKMVNEAINRTKKAKDEIGLENAIQQRKLNSVMGRIIDFEDMDEYEAKQMGLIYNNLAPDDTKNPISAKMVKDFLENIVKVQNPEAYEKIIDYYDFKKERPDKYVKKLSIFVENIWNTYRTVEYCYMYSKGFHEFVDQYAEKVDADVVLANDPDADRLGVYAKDSKTGEYHSFTGNMSGLLIAEYELSQKKERGEILANGALIKTIVSSNLADAIAKEYNLKLIEVLTGFKYIGEQMRLFEQSHEYTYMFGFEESYGCLIGTHARDKDGIAAVMALCEAAAYYKEKGYTLWDQMINIYKKYGFYKELTISITREGVTGAEEIKQMMEKMRENPATTLGKYKVVEFRDYKKDIIKNNATREITKTGLPNSNVLYYGLENDAWCCVRPSGTEPKIKFYMGVKGKTEEEAEQELKELTKVMEEQAKM